MQTFPSPSNSPTSSSIPEFEDPLNALGAHQIEALVDLRCRQLQTLADWQSQRAAEFGHDWVDEVGREAEFWIVLLESAGRLDPLQQRRLHDAMSRTVASMSQSTL